MIKVDTRKLPMGALQQLRYDVIKLRQEGFTYKRISKILNVSSVSVWKYCKNYKLKGEEGIKNKKRGVKTGTNSKLNNMQTEELKRILITKTPSTFNISYCLWSRRAIQDLVLIVWSILMPLRTITDYMKRLNFTLQKPIKHAYQQDPSLIDQWIKINFPIIKKKALKENAEIHWLDETGICSNSNYIRGFSPKGETPEIKMGSSYININMISTVTNKGQMRFLLSERYINTEKLIEFTTNLCKEINRKIFLLLDNSNVHKSKKFISWVKNNSDKIEIFYLPPYCPDINPDERLNRDVKTHFHSGPTSKNKKEFIKKLIKLLTEIQYTPTRIINYFYSEFTKYAL